jgi:hypothetical protein
MMERMQLLQRLERVMEETEFGWSLLMVERTSRANWPT